jgi:PAS domain S-box-containing protein
MNKTERPPSHTTRPPFGLAGLGDLRAAVRRWRSAITAGRLRGAIETMRKSRPLLVLAGLGVVIALGTALFTSRYLGEREQRETDQAIAILDAAARGVETQISSAVQTLSVIFSVAAERIAEEMAGSQPDWILLEGWLGRLRGQHPLIHDIGAMTREGLVVAHSSPVSLVESNVTNHPYFMGHKELASLAVTVSRIVRPLASGAFLIPVTRRLNDSRGGFAGVVRSSIETKTLETQIRNVRMGGVSALALYFDDGTLVASSLGLPELVGRKPGLLPLFDGQADLTATGALHVDRTLAGGPGHIAYRRISDTPFIVVANMRDDVIATHLKEGRATTLATAVGVAFVMFTLIGALAGLIIRADRIRREREDSEKRFRDFSAMASDWYWEMDADLRLSKFAANRAGGSVPLIGAAVGKQRHEVIDHAVPREALARHLDDLANRRPFRHFVYKSRLARNRFIRISGEPVFDPSGAFQGYRGVGTDVSELMALREGFDTLIDTVMVGVAIFDKDDCLVRANDMFFVGADGAAPPGPGAAFAEIARFLAEHVADPETTPDGAAAWQAQRIERHRNPGEPHQERDGDGRIWSVSDGHAENGTSIVLRTDVSDAVHRAEFLTALVKRNAMLAAAVDATTAGIMITDPRIEGRPTVFVNKGFTQLTGYSAEDAIGRNPSFLQGPATDRAAIAEIAAAVQARRPGTVRLANRCKDGRDIMIDFRISPVFGRAGDLQYFVGIQTDVTEQMAAETSLVEREAQLRAIAANLPSVVYQRKLTRAGEYSYSYIAPSFYALSGYTAEECMADPELMLAMIPDAWRQALIAGVRSSASYLSRLEFEMPIKRRDGAERWVRTTSMPRRVANGDIVWDGILTDISQERADRQQKEAMELQIRHLQKLESIGTLAAGIAHDLNNALVPIVGLSHLMLRRVGEDGWLRQNVLRIQEAAGRCRDLVASIVAFSRRGTADKTLVDLPALIGNGLKILEATLPISIKVTSRVAPLSGSIVGDPTEITQVLINLATNGAQAIGTQPGGTIQIELDEIDAREVPDGHAKQFATARVARLSLADNGCGMPAETIARIFDPFFTTKPVGEGTGLGLSMVHRIITGMGGAVTVTSEIGRGTRFNIFMPIVAAAQGVDDRSREAAAGSTVPNAEERTPVGAH